MRDEVQGTGSMVNGEGYPKIVDVTGQFREDEPSSLGTLVPLRGLGVGAEGTGAAKFKVVAKREHPIYSARAEQLEINLLALDGGAPYIEERLSRFAGESAIDWNGGNRADGTPVTGRLSQAHCIPYPGRIADKINQFVFAQEAKREGGDAEIVNDITRNGESVSQFMRSVNRTLTACRWCWVGIDSPMYDGATTTLAQKEEQKLRPYWTLYSPTEVVDWYIAGDGTLMWLITEGTQYTAKSPFEAGVEQKVRDLWEPGKRTRFTFKGSKVVSAEVFVFPLKKVPFVLVGTLSDKPYLFDSIESMNRTIMDLESCSRQNFFERVFPQMYLPAGAVSAASRVWAVTESQAAEMIVGLSYPILVDKDDATPGYVQPNAADLAQIDVKSDKLREAMFECVGLMLRQESRSAQSGESKAWDHLDAEAVLADRAQLLEEVEEKLVAMTVEWDASISAWEPQYPRTFDVTDFAAGIQAITQGAQVSQPPELKRLGLRVLLQMYKKLHRVGMTPEQEQEILDAIDEFGDEAMEPIGGNPFDGAAPGGFPPKKQIGAAKPTPEELAKAAAEKQAEDEAAAEEK